MATDRFESQETQDDIDALNINISALNPSDYITINSGITVNGVSLTQIAEHIAILNLDIRATLNEGQTTIGQVKNTVKMITYLSGRGGTSSGKTYPATGVAIPNGELRIHVVANSVAGVINGILVI